MNCLVLGACLLVLVMLAAPISLGYDSGEKWLKIKWLGLSLTKRLVDEKPKKQKTSTAKRKRRGGAMFKRLWARRELCLELIQRGLRFMLEVVKGLNFRDSRASVCLPDPMWNGLLFGVVSTIHLEQVSLSVNFENRNYVKIQVVIYPYRVASKLAAFLLQLPYIRIVRFAWDLKKT